MQQRSKPVRVSGLTDVKAIAAGYRYNLALKNDGTVWAWGSGSFGQLGNGSQSYDLSTPVQISGLTNVKAIAAGTRHSLAVKNDGTVWAWGNNQYGELGLGSAGGSRSTPGRVSGLTGAVSVAAGEEHVSFAVKNDGTAWAWGDNSYGLLGDGTSQQRNAPVRVSGLTDVKEVEVGVEHALAVKNSGEAWAWGINSAGQTGTGRSSSAPVQVKDPNAPDGTLAKVTEVAAGDEHSLAVKTDATPTDDTPPSLELPADVTEEATTPEGATVTFAATATDEDPTIPEVICSPVSGSTFPMGETTVNCLSTDTAGNKAEGTFKVTVKDATPPNTAKNSGPDGWTNENTPTFTFSGSDKVSAGAQLLFSYRVDDGNWSDYTSQTSATLGGATGLGGGSHTFYVRAKDEAGNEDASPAERTFTVNEPPAVDAGGPYTVKEGGSIEVKASASDPEGKELTYAWDLNNDGSFNDASTQTATFDASKLDGPTTQAIKLEVTDDKGAKATDEATVNVNNEPPTATFNSSSPVDEGGSFNLSLDDPSDASDADDTKGFTYAFDCGNGYGAYGSANKASCSTEDNGRPTVKGTIRDKDGGTTEYTASVEVNNVRPTITKISGPSQVLTAKKIVFTAEATDPSSADTKAGFSWEWAVDGSSYSSGPNPFEATFSSCGNHTVSAKAKDKDGAQSEPVTSGTASAYEGRFEQPLEEGVNNLVQKGRVVPVKVKIGCGDATLTNLRPAIQLLSGDKTSTSESSSDEVETYSASSADTTGAMRSVDGGFIYNLEVPTKYSDGAEVNAGDKFTIRVRPFGDNNKEASMTIVLEIK